MRISCCPTSTTCTKSTCGFACMSPVTSEAMILFGQLSGQQTRDQNPLHVGESVHRSSSPRESMGRFLASRIVAGLSSNRISAWFNVSKLIRAATECCKSRREQPSTLNSLRYLVTFFSQHSLVDRCWRCTFANPWKYLGNSSKWASMVVCWV